MAELSFNLEEPYHLMLLSLKPVAETVLEQEIELNAYLNLVIQRGIQGIIEDIVPRDPDILLKSILMMYEENPEFVGSFISNVLKAGGAREDAKERLGFKSP